MPLQQGCLNANSSEEMRPTQKFKNIKDKKPDHSDFKSLNALLFNTMFSVHTILNHKDTVTKSALLYERFTVFNNNNNNTLLTIDSYKVLYTYPQIAEASRGG